MKTMQRINHIVIIFALITFAPLAGAQATEWYVTTNGNDSADGLSWETAFETIQNALDHAGTDDTIYLAGQTFSISNQIVWTTPGITIRGGYEAPDTNPESLPGAHDPNSWPTVIVRSGDSIHRIIYINSADDNTLEHVTITGGQVGFSSGPLSNQSTGGGIHIRNSANILLSGCTIVSNRWETTTMYTTRGAGLYAGGSSVTLSNCLVKANGHHSTRSSSHQVHYGGGIWSSGGTLSLINTRIIENHMTDVFDGSLANVGGIYFDGTSLTMRNVLLARNRTTGIGGGLRILGGTTVLTNVTVAHNLTEGISIEPEAEVELINSIVWGNWTDLDGEATLASSNIGDQPAGSGNLGTDPKFEYGYGYNLAADSPCRNAASDTAANLGLSSFVKNKEGDLYGLEEIANMGYHHPTGFDLTLANLYVSPHGDDTNDGRTSDLPFLTIGKALSNACNGTQIHLAPGEYTPATESFPLVMQGLVGVQLLGPEEGYAVLDAQGSSSETRRVLTLENLRHPLLRNLIITGGYFTSAATRGAGLAMDNSYHIRLEKCSITNNTIRLSANISANAPRYAGIYATETTELILTESLVQNNIAHSTGRSGARSGGIGSYGSLELHNSKILDNHATRDGSSGTTRGGGIYFMGPRLEMKNTLVAGNQITKADDGQGGGIYAGGAADLINVTVVSNVFEGVRVGATLTVLNSILWGNENDIIGGQAMDVNVSYSNIEHGEHVDENQVHLGTDNINCDPLFANPSDGNYRLLPESPSSRTGLIQAWMVNATDLDGKPRISMNQVDMGCYQIPPPRGTFFIIR